MRITAQYLLPILPNAGVKVWVCTHSLHGNLTVSDRRVQTRCRVHLPGSAM